MYFQINESIPMTYLFITYYPSMDSLRSRTKVNILLLSSLPFFLDTLDLNYMVYHFVPCEFFHLTFYKLSLSKFHRNTQARALG